MTRPEQLMKVLRDPNGAVLEGRHPADLPLLTVFVRMAYADGRVGHKELDLLRRLRPNESEDSLLLWVAEVGNRPLDLRELAEVLSTREEREDAMLFLGWMAAEDDRLNNSEVNLLAQVRQALGL